MIIATDFVCNSFDIDGVIHMDGGYGGVYPGPHDIIITGRSEEERPETLKMLEKKGIKNKVYFNPIPFNRKTRETSGIHKANTILSLIDQGIGIQIHFEDDPVQIKEMKSILSKSWSLFLFWALQARRAWRARRAPLSPKGWVQPLCDSGGAEIPSRRWRWSARAGSRQRPP